MEALTIVLAIYAIMGGFMRATYLAVKNKDEFGYFAWCVVGAAGIIILATI